MDFERVIAQAMPLLNEGVKLTVLVSVLSLLIGMIIGFFICIMGRSRIAPLKWIAAVYIWIIRGTPMLVQAFIVYFGIPQLITTCVPDFMLEPYNAGIITLSLNAGAYLSEIFRGGINAVNKGQVEAARSLGLSSGRTMLKLCCRRQLKLQRRQSLISAS